MQLLSDANPKISSVVQKLKDIVKSLQEYPKEPASAIHFQILQAIITVLQLPSPNIGFVKLSRSFSTKLLQVWWTNVTDGYHSSSQSGSKADSSKEEQIFQHFKDGVVRVVQTRRTKDFLNLMKSVLASIALMRKPKTTEAFIDSGLEYLSRLLHILSHLQQPPADIEESVRIGVQFDLLVMSIALEKVSAFQGQHFYADITGAHLSAFAESQLKGEGESPLTTALSVNTSLYEHCRFTNYFTELRCKPVSLHSYLKGLVSSVINSLSPVDRMPMPSSFSEFVSIMSDCVDSICTTPQSAFTFIPQRIIETVVSWFSPPGYTSVVDWIFRLSSSCLEREGITSILLRLFCNIQTHIEPTSELASASYKVASALVRAASSNAILAERLLCASLASPWLSGLVMFVKRVSECDCSNIISKMMNIKWEYDGLAFTEAADKDPGGEGGAGENVEISENGPAHIRFVERFLEEKSRPISLTGISYSIHSPASNSPETGVLAG